MAPRIYKTPAHAARAFVRAGRKTGAVTVLGGGWWRITGRAGKVQGLTALAWYLEHLGTLRRLTDGRAELLTPTS